MDYVVYCDESHQDKNAHHCYMSMGGLWVPRSSRDLVSREARRIAREGGARGEVKWHKTSDVCLDSYKNLVDYFFDTPSLQYSVVVVDQREVDVQKHHDGDWWRFYYVTYYELLHKWLLPQDRNWILMDVVPNQERRRFTTLRDVLSAKLRDDQCIADIVAVQSDETPLIQLCDLLTGAVAARWCDVVASDSAKARLIEHIERRRGCSLSVPSASPAKSKFNVFRMRLQPSDG